MLDVNRRKHIPDQNHALSLTDVRLKYEGKQVKIVWVK